MLLPGGQSALFEANLMDRLNVFADHLFPRKDTTEL
jgi:hypothetical protein